MKPVILVEHLKKSFGDNVVLKDISLKIDKGENVAILGKSGTGKSVLIKCMVRLIDPDEGKLFVLGEEVMRLNTSQLNELRRRIGFLFQGSALYDSMTVRENLEFPLLRHRRKKVTNLNNMVIEALENVGLVDAINKMPSELSGGMKKRVGLARTLILNPEIILYDEPTTGLDPITAKEISQLIVHVQKKYQTSSIIITHDLNCVRTTSNRIIMLKDGLIEAEGSFDELVQSTNKWVRLFFE